MKKLFLLRHGQANSGGRDYDMLSELGEKQASLTGEYFRRAGFSFDLIGSGSLHRQKHTAELVASSLGKDTAGIMTFPELDEFSMLIWMHYAAKLREVSEEFAEILATWQQLRRESGPEKAAAKGEIFKKLTAHIIRSWRQAEFDQGNLETFASFQGRIHRLAQIAWNARGENILFVTSGGPIATFTAAVFGGGAEMPVTFLRNIANCSLHGFQLRGPSPEQTDLISFNSTGHFPSLAEVSLV